MRAKRKRQGVKLLACLPIAVLSLLSCEEEIAQNQNQAAPKVVWDWAKFEKSSQFTLESISVDLQPKRSLAIRSEAAGVMTMNLTEKVQKVSKGQVIAKMDVEALAEQQERLDIMQQKHVLDTMKTEKLDVPERQKTAKDALAEARRKVKLLELVMKNSAMREMSHELFGGDIGEIDEKSLQEARDELSLAERKMAWTEEFDEKLRKGQTRIQEMDLTKSKRQFENVKQRSIYEAPFAGELRFEVDFVEGQKEYTVGGRETFATLNDYTEIHALIGVENANWINLDPKRFFLELKDRNQTLMEFKEDRIEKNDRTRREERKYVFSTPLEEKVALKRLAGTKMTASLYYRLPAMCYIVPKYDLSLYALGKTDSLDWGEMVRQIWPEAEVLAVGRESLAIEYRKGR